MARTFWTALMRHKTSIFNVMYTVQLLDTQRFDTHLEMHTSMHDSSGRLAQEFQKHLSLVSRKYGLLDYGKQRKSLRKKWTNREYHVKKKKMLSTKVLKCIVLQISFLDLHFVVHTTNHTVHAD